MTLKRLAGYGPAFVLAVAILLIWQLIVKGHLITATILPPPTAIVQALLDNWDVLSVHTLQTTMETVLGLGIATILGVVLAILLDLSPWIRRAVYPLLITSQTIPMVALAPLLIIWFGLDLSPKIIVVALYCFFPIAVAFADGLASTDPELMKLMQSMKATRWQALWLVRLPGAMPSFFSGLRIAATYSVTGAIVGEYVAAQQGLGIYMELAARSNVVVLVFAAIVVTAVLSLLLFGLVSLLERIALPWHQSQISKR
ncbi:ABC transporter permease [Dictyobacter arantiisoli]|uniref:Nitrate ABC transporter permease n=1 Tax=Dictyobacter arantiisoli TaxID=2014874 RepID=A0A5A5T8Z4_9CHLR|nr:ABC transporter permease [Dictyobacter arantiisoli]GCF07735.1 nitrate ABC transporter permease [Dictyobacter arantiisoli]